MTPEWRDRVGRSGTLPKEGATPQRDAGAPAYHKRGRASPPLPDPRFAGPLGPRSGAPHSKELQRGHVPQKPCNPPRSELTKKVKANCLEKSSWIIAVN